MIRAITCSHSLITPLRRSAPQTCQTQFRSLTLETKDGDHAGNINSNAKDRNFVDFVIEICRVTRTTPRWETTLLSQYPSFNFKDPSFFLHYLTHQHNAFLSLRFFYWLCSSCGFSPDQSSCSALFDELVNAGASKAAKALLDWPDFNPGPHSLEGYIRSLSSGGMVEDALHVFDELQKVGFCPSAETWKKSLLGCLKVGRTDLVWTLYGRMLESGVAANIDVETVGYLVKALCVEGKVSKGYELLRQVLGNGLSPDNTVFNTLIRGFCKNGEYDRVSEILHIMIAKKGNPDIFTYQEVINGLLKENNSEGLRVFNDIKDRAYFPDRVMYTTVIEGLCKKGQLGVARKLWFEMIQKGLLPNEYTYNVMLHGYCKAGELVEAKKLFNDMRSRGYVGNTFNYTTMISGLCSHGEAHKAWVLFQKMPQRGVVRDLITYNSLINGLCNEGDLVKATKLFNELQTQGLQPSAFTFTPLIKGLCRFGETQEAIRLWNDMRDRHLIPPSITHDHIIKGLCKEGNSAEGMKWLRRMVRWELKPVRKTLEILICTLSQEKRLDDVLIVLDSMFRLGYTLEHSTIHFLVTIFNWKNDCFTSLCLEKILGNKR
ncbi:hypothetical protein HN51_021014 [Arachis hypogaea]|uniref:Pentatricopeptide repeat-containing protein n=1 Tax=Arachis hypogaea TaxID=3818 RepID=A0A445EIA2_ARAHY|nr:pentatricopeptide repeat-containing protein At5g18950 [Arachis hypogaea]XP_029146711.1 pentatricopeptide repeat-containing protein At5g18950 [Arachis hypogaea]QHO51925.1 Pentatricopeptide repeat-containing protein [Arachis hypogaea]RYR75187.1 hypothetical protein Ahy_A02g009862 [Arachis hypogaea]